MRDRLLCAHATGSHRDSMQCCNFLPVEMFVFWFCCRESYFIIMTPCHFSLSLSLSAIPILEIQWSLFFATNTIKSHYIPLYIYVQTPNMYTHPPRQLLLIHLHSTLEYPAYRVNPKCHSILFSANQLH